MSYTFRVGIRELNMRSFKTPVKPVDKNTGGKVAKNYGYTHACLLLGNDLFEYGVNSNKQEEKTFERKKNVGRDTSFDWDELGDAMNGTTNISPDELEAVIIEAKEWNKGHYNTLKHNCHDFVKFCLKKVGCKECLTKNETTLKICYDRQKLKNIVKIVSAFDSKCLGIKGYIAKNLAEIILKYDYGSTTTNFIPIYNKDKTVTFTIDKYAIDVRWSQAKSGTIIHLWEKNGTKAQKFFLRERGEYVSIHSSIDPKYVIEAKNGYSFDETAVQLEEYSEGKKGQLFKLI